MKQALAVLLCAALVLSVLLIPAFADAQPVLKGSGTPQDPYLIATAKDLMTFFNLTAEDNGQYGDKAYRLCADISLNSGSFSFADDGDILYNGAPSSEDNQPVLWRSICAPREEEPDFCFRGTFDGDGHTISGLYGESLFGLCRNAYIKNLSIENAAVTDGSALLCAQAFSCTVEDCTVGGCSTGSGMIFAAKDSQLLHCTSNAVLLSNSQSVGGIVGTGVNNKILLCDNNGSVQASSSSDTPCNAGGIVGSSGPGDEVALCTNRGSVTADGSAGGICGKAIALDLFGQRNTYIMCANIGSIRYGQRDTYTDDLGMSTGRGSSPTVVLCCYTTGKDGGSYHGRGRADADAGSRETVTNPQTGAAVTKWIAGHINSTVSGVTQTRMQAPYFPAMVNDGYAYVLDGQYYQFAFDANKMNGGYPAVRAVPAKHLTGIQTLPNYVDGTGNALFQPTKPMSRAELAQVFYALLQPMTPGTERFSDVPGGMWFSKAVNAMAQAGYLGGYPDGTFGPNRMVMRCELAQVLAKVSGATLGERTTTFTDVNAGYWAYDAIALAQERGWVSGVGGSTFLPNGQVSRAEAVTAINAFLGRTTDKDMVDSHRDARRFFDLRPGTWYYYNVITATTKHSVIQTNYGEQWLGISQHDAGLSNGFYLYGTDLYLVQNNRFVTTAGSGSYQGFEYTCAGDSGICTVNETLLPLSDGTVCVLKNGKPWANAGYFAYNGSWYYGQADCRLLQNGTWNTLQFDAEGRYTSGNSDIDAYVDSIVSSVTTDDMTQEEQLRACYDYVQDHVVYQSINNHVPHGADASTWTEAYMLRLIERGKGNCYCFAAQMYYLARRVGYAQAKAISGQDSPDGYTVDHGWVEIAIDGVPYLFDPEMNHTRGLAPGALFKITYSQAPWEYYPA